MHPNANEVFDKAVFRIGRVIAVRGRSVDVLVDKTKNTSHFVFNGELLKSISVGGYLRIAKGFAGLVGKVEGEQITEEKAYSGLSYGNDRQKVKRILNISLVGFFRDGRFERGIKELPLIDNECFLLRKAEFEQVHNFVRDGEDSITIGSLAFEKEQDVRVGVNAMFASHIGIFGNTGSGKSYTLAKLYRELFLKYMERPTFRSSARFFLFDFNGEYMDEAAGGDNIIIDHQFKRTYRLTTRAQDGDRFPLAPDVLLDPEFWVIFLEATEKTQTPFLRRAVGNAYISERVRHDDTLKEILQTIVFAMTSEGDRTIEKSIVVNLFSDLRIVLGEIPELTAIINDYKSRLKFHNQNFVFYYEQAGVRLYSNDVDFRARVVDEKIQALILNVEGINLIDEIRLTIIIQYYEDIVRGYTSKEHIAPLIKRMDKRIDDLKKVVTVADPDDMDNDRFITIVGLKDVNLHMRKILPFLLAKKLYNDKKIENDPDNFLNIIIDEAHNVLSSTSDRESEQWKDHRLETFEEIIKEGRKFGAFLTIASQRPSDISPTIISQLHNYFLHRLINVEDISMIRQTVSYLDKVSFESLPILPTGTCILAGLLANIPVVLDIGKIEPAIHEPRNKTITLTDKWT